MGVRLESVVGIGNGIGIDNDTGISVGDSIWV